MFFCMWLFFFLLNIKFMNSVLAVCVVVTCLRHWVGTYMLSCVSLFATWWTAAHQALLYMEFSRQEYWSRLPFPPPGSRDPGIEPLSSESSALAGRFLPLNHLGRYGYVISAEYSIVWTFIHSTVNGHMDCFQLFPANNTALHTLKCVFCCTRACMSLRYHLRGGE